MKKLISIALSLLILVSFSACNSPSENPPDNKTTAPAKQLLETTITELKGAKALSITGESIPQSTDEPTFIIVADVNPQTKDAAVNMQIKIDGTPFDVIDVRYIEAEKQLYFNIKKVLDFISDPIGYAYILEAAGINPDIENEDSDALLYNDLYMTLMMLQFISLPDSIKIPIDEIPSNIGESSATFDEIMGYLKDIYETIISDSEATSVDTNIITIQLNDNMAEQIATTVADIATTDANTLFSFLSSFSSGLSDESVLVLYTAMASITNTEVDYVTPEEAQQGMTIGNKFEQYLTNHEENLKMLTAEAVLLMHEPIKDISTTEIATVLRDEAYEIEINCGNEPSLSINQNESSLFNIKFKPVNEIPVIIPIDGAVDIDQMINMIYSQMD